MPNYAIEIEGLWKQYRLGERQSYVALRDILSDPLSAFRGKPKEEFWALKDINLKVKEGEVLGVIGKNGSGKSTLLKILTRITPPTKGQIKLHGRVASLLEVGTGFNPELTGRENIYLNGSILGMTRREIRRKFDEIVNFSGVEKFIDTPVKRYSSGMYVRLAFAVAAHLESEILLVDEVLAVGDMEFQKKCLSKMESLSKSGKSVFFVSHNLAAVQQLCTRSILLSQGELRAVGDIQSVIQAYTSQDSSELGLMALTGPLETVVMIRSVSIQHKSPEAILPSEQIGIKVKLETTEKVPDFFTTLSIYAQSTRLLTIHDTAKGAMLKGNVIVEYSLPAKLLRPGEYSIAVGGFSKSDGRWLFATSVATFRISEIWSTDYRQENIGLINLQLTGKRKQA